MHLKKLSVRFSFFLLLLATCLGSFAQTTTAGLLKKLKKAEQEKAYRTDTTNTGILGQLSDHYLYDNADSALYFAKQALQLSQNQKYISGQAKSWSQVGKAYYVLGDYTASLDAANNLMNISHKINYQPGIARAYQIMGLIYLGQDNYTESIVNFNRSLNLFIQLKEYDPAGKAYFDLGICYDETGQAAKAFYYLGKALAIANNVKDNNLIAMILNRTGEIYYHSKNYGKALTYYMAVVNSKLNSTWEKDFAYSGIAQCNYALGKYQPAILNAQKSYALSRQVNSASDAIRAMQILAESYAALKDYQPAYTWQIQLKKANDSFFNREKEKEVDYLHLKQQQADNRRLENDIKNKEQSIAFARRLLFFRNLIAAATITFFIFIIIGNRQKTALNKVLKKRNDDIALQKEEISRQKEVLDKLNHTKDQLFAVISHDLRSPFAAIMQSIDAIRAGDVNAEEQAELMDSFHLQVNGVTTMVNNLLAWANSQQSGITSSPEALDIAVVVDDIISVSDFLAKNKNITISHEYNGEKRAVADPDHLKIIIQNLIGNAIKFTGEGGKVEIFYSEDHQNMAIHVRDNGTGIPPEKMDKLFKVTGKEISGYGTNNEGGAGIGLALIKQFTDANNGKLDVKSQVGMGSEFTVYLPKQEAGIKNQGSR